MRWFSVLSLAYRFYFVPDVVLVLIVIIDGYFLVLFVDWSHQSGHFVDAIEIFVHLVEIGVGRESKAPRRFTALIKTTKINCIEVPVCPGFQGTLRGALEVKVYFRFSFFLSLIHPDSGRHQQSLSFFSDFMISLLLLMFNSTSFGFLADAVVAIANAQITVTPMISLLVLNCIFITSLLIQSFIFLVMFGLSHLIS